MVTADEAERVKTMTTHNYTVTHYDYRGHKPIVDQVTAVEAPNAFAAVSIAAGRRATIGSFASVTSRWQRSPDAKADSRGLCGWYAVRAEITPADAEARNAAAIRADV